MKTTITFISIILFTVLYSCQKEPDHSIRIANDSDRTISVRLDDTILYEIEANKRSAYRPIQEGPHSIQGDYSIEFTITGNGVYFWTIKITDDNAELIQE